MNSIFRTTLIFTCLAATWGADACAAASDVSGQIERLRLGVQGQAKVGRWAMVLAECSGLEPGKEYELHVSLPDPQGHVCVQQVADGRASQDGRLALHGWFRCGRVEGAGTVAVTADDVTVCRQSISFSDREQQFEPDRPLQLSLQTQKQNLYAVATVGDVRGISELLRNITAYGDSRTQLVHYHFDTVADLPQDWRGLDAIDKFLLTDSFDLTEQQTAALVQWVRDGGELFVCTGGTVSEFLQTPIGRWVDQYFELDEKPFPLRQFNSLESFVPGASRIQTSIRGRSEWPVAAVGSDQVAVLVNSLDGPLVSQRSAGGGVVTLVSVDINQVPFSNWTSLPQFYEVLFFGRKLDGTRVRQASSSRISQSGVTDIGTQLLATVDAEPQSGTWSTWAVMGMVVGWMLLIGPVDYFVVSRLLQKPQLTWITFPSLIAAATFAVYQADGRDEREQLNALHVVDLSSEGQQHDVTSRSWLSLSTPRTMRNSCSVSPGPLFAKSTTAHDIRLSWSGRAEDVFGGMYRRGGIGLGRQTYRLSDKTPQLMQHVPLLTNSSHGFEVTQHAVLNAPPATSELSVSGYGILQGSFQHHLPNAINNWLLINGNRVYQSNTEEGRRLEPGEVWTSDAEDVVTADLKNFLNASRRVQKSYQSDSEQSAIARHRSTQVVTPYDIHSRDIRYITMMASFYDFAGGSDYTGLLHHQLRRLEISDTIRLNHAVLIGEVDSDAVEFQLGENVIQPTSGTTLVRLFLPVNRRPADEMARTREEAEADDQDSSTP